ncbi:MAG: hypothetical protein U0Q15_11005 [Kineosporiaceae bacterium]
MNATVTCPGCRRQVAHLARCPECDYPLVLVPQAAQAPAAPHAPARRPGERPGAGQEPTQVIPPVGPPVAPRPPVVQQEPTLPCPDPSCRAANPLSRTLCVRCGARLRPEPVAVTPLPAPEPPRAPSRTPRIVAGIVALAAVVGLGAWAGTTLFRAPDRPAPAPQRSLPASSDAAPVAIPAASVSAVASSVQKPAGSIRYDAANLLDGDPTTAWNSDGGLRPGASMTVTFTFDRVYDLRSVTVLDGYQKSRPRSGKAPLDLFTANARPSKVELRTDASKAAWTLQDVRTPQTLKAPLGATKTLTIVIQGAYRGEKYDDLAISEVSFTGVPVG